MKIGNSVSEVMQIPLFNKVLGVVYNSVNSSFNKSLRPLIKPSLNDLPYDSVRYNVEHEIR